MKNRRRYFQAVGTNILANAFMTMKMYIERSFYIARIDIGQFPAPVGLIIFTKYINLVAESGIDYPIVTSPQGIEKEVSDGYTDPPPFHDGNRQSKSESGGRFLELP